MNSWGENFGERGTLRLLRQDSEEWVRWWSDGERCFVSMDFPKKSLVGCNQICRSQDIVTWPFYKNIRGMIQIS